MTPLEELTEHLRDADAVVVCDGSGDVAVAALVAAGWTLEEGAEYVGGRRIRTLLPPEESL